MPAANEASPPFRTSWGLSIDSDSPVPQLGVNPAENLRVTFELIGGRTFALVAGGLLSFAFARRGWS